MNEEKIANENVAEEETVTQTADKPKEKDKDIKKQNKELKAENAALAKKNEDLTTLVAETNDKYLRLAAEYENFRKRSQREREATYDDATFDAIRKLLPTIDNLERAAQYTDPEKLADGVMMILKTLPDTLTSLGVEAFGESGEEFDPNIHNAVMMVSDENTESGKIVGVLQRGYKRGDKVLRYAMVTVAE